MYQMIKDGAYGTVTVPPAVFEKLDPEYLISHSTDTVKYMCANASEAKHLEALGITPLWCCDWYKILLDKSVTE